MTGMDRIAVWPENGNGADAGNIDAIETIARPIREPGGTAQTPLTVRGPPGQAGGLSMAAHYRGWECAFELAHSHAARLTPAQHVACIVTTMQHPDCAPFDFIALACHVLGKRT